MVPWWPKPDGCCGHGSRRPDRCGHGYAQPLWPRVRPAPAATGTPSSCGHGYAQFLETWHAEAMTALPPRVTAVLGAQEFLADRAVQERGAQWRATGAELRDVFAGGDGLLAELLSAASPDLFGSSPVIVLRGFEALPELEATEVLDLVTRSAPTGWIIIHNGGRGSTKARTKLERSADDVIKVEALKGRGIVDFVQKEFRVRGKTTDQATVDLLMTAVGADPRGLASAVAQLSSDIEDRHVGQAAAAQYYSGHVEVKGYEIADAVANRDPEQACEALRFAFHEGGTRAGLMTVSALSTTLRRLAVAKTARRSHPAADVAAALKIPEWIARSAVAQARNWTSDEIADALSDLAELTVVLKGGYSPEATLTDPQKEFVVERVVMRLATPAT